MSVTWQTKTSLPLGTRRNVITPVTPQITGTIEICCGPATSETYGYAGYNDSYRLNLYNLLTDPARGNLSISMIGFQTNGTAPADKSHGIVGSDTTQWLSGGTYDAATPARNIGTVNTPHYNPALFLIELGMNDALDATKTANFRTNIVALVNYLHGLCPSARFLLFTVFGAVARQTNIDLINAQWAGIESDLDALGVKYAVCPLHTVIAPKGSDQAASEAPNYTHVNPRGQLKWADAAYPYVMNLLGYDAVW